jgi:PAS domain S-box-containing protein
VFNPASAFIGRLQRSLLARIVVSFIVLSTLIVLLMTASGSSFFLRTARARIIEHLQTLVAVKVALLNGWVDIEKMKVASLAELSELRHPAAALRAAGPGSAEAAGLNLQLRDFLFALAPYQAEFRRLTLISADTSRVLFSTDKGMDGSETPPPEVITEGAKGPFVTAVDRSPITRQPELRIAAPVRDEGRKVVAVLVADLDMNVLDRIILDPTGLGDTGEAYLVDRERHFVSSWRFGREDYAEGARSQGIDAAVRGESGSGMYANYSGVPVIGVYRWIPDRAVALVVEQRRFEAFRSLRVQIVLMVSAGLLFVFLFAGGVAALARRIVSPIMVVRRAALRVSAGDMTARAPVSTGDEIGDLAASFNAMTEKVQGLYEELKTNEERFRSLIESSSDLIYVLDERGTISFISPSVERLLGYTAASRIGTDPLSLVHPDDQERIRRHFADLGSRTDSSFQPVLCRVGHADGSWRTLESLGRNLRLHPAIRGFVITARDVTDREQLEERLRQALKMEAVGRLAGGVAHDFNNILTAIIGYADMLAGQPELVPESRDFLSEIRTGAGRAAGLTQQLLAYSRKQVLQPRVIDLNALIRSTEAMLRRLIGETIALSSDLADGLSRVRADPNQIEQVILNLCLNSRDAMPEGGAIVLVTRDVVLDKAYCSGRPDASPGPHVLLGVGDNGHGMTAEVRSRVFEPFFTTKAVGKGTGLGLATAYGIVRQSGGHVTVCSDVGWGTNFRVYLPAVVGQASADEEPLSQAVLSRGAGHVLVVEDEEPVRRMVAMSLDREGYEVHATSGPEEAARHSARVPRIDLLVTDVVLPGMNGRRLADALLAAHPEMKVLFMSGYTEDAIVDQGVLDPGISFLQKPFTPKDLAEKARRVLERRAEKAGESS